MPQAVLPALFGLVAMLVAAEAIRSGQVTLRGMRFARETRPAAFRLTVAIYVGLGLLSLAGAAWICLLSAGVVESHPAPQRAQPGRVASPPP